MLNITKTCCVAAMAALVAPAFAADWMTDLDAAKARAAAEGKAVLVDFTGSDWCGWCIRLRKNVFDKPEFDAYAADKFVLMEVDVPNNPNFDQELLKRNHALCEQYKVSGFPTIMVMTPAGEVVGGFVGGKASLEEACEPLDAALANAAALKAAEALEGAEKVQALYGVYEQLPEEFREVSPLRARIAELDEANTTGMRDAIRAQQQMEGVIARLRAAGKDGRAMLAVVDEAVQSACPQNLTRLLEMKMGIQLSLAETEEDILAAKKTLLDIADADPENAEAIRATAEQRFADPAKLLQSIRKRRGK